MKKINANKYVKKVSSPAVLLTIIALMGTSAYFLLFTDMLICRNCAVKNGSIKVSNSELKDAVSIKENFYKYSKSDYDAEKLKQETLKQLLNQKRIENYAKEKGIKVSKQELDDLYKDRVKQSGSEDELLNKIKAMYGISKNDYLEVLRQDILSEKVQKNLGIPLADWLK